MNRHRLLLALLLLAVRVPMAPAVEFTRDGAVVLAPAQVSDATDGTHSGKRWDVFVPFAAPIAVGAGDILRGTITFGGNLLRLRDVGGGFLQVGIDGGLERVLVLGDAVEPSQTSDVIEAFHFTDVRGPFLELGGDQSGMIDHNGLILQADDDFVAAGGALLVSGIKYRLFLLTGGPFTIAGIGLAALAEQVGIEARAPGDVAYRTCITGEAGPSPEGNDACAASGSVTGFGANSGLDNLRSIVTSGDGTSLYVVSGFDDAVAHFVRDRASGVLEYQTCISGETESGLSGSNACALIGSASAGGAGSGLDALQSVALSPDGASLYTAAVGDDAVAHFERNAMTGALEYKGCMTGDLVSNSDACLAIDFAQVTGASSGLDGVRAVVVSADGTSLYAVSPEDDAVAHFQRDPATGNILYKGCISGETESGPAGSQACALIDGATSGGADSGLDSLFSLALSADGLSLYATSLFDAAIARFDRDPATGTLTYQGCITGETESGPTGSNACTAIATAASFGTNSGFDNLWAVTLSPDDASVYAVAEDDDAVVRFARDPATGALTYQDCISGETQSGTACALIPSATPGGTNSGLDKLRNVLVSPEGTTLYVASPADDAIARFTRDPAMGALAYVECLTGEFESSQPGTGACGSLGSATSFGTDCGVDNPQAFTLSADGRSLYVASGNDAAVGRFDREPAPTTTTSSSTTSTSASGASTTSTTLAPDRVSGQKLVIVDNPKATKRKIVFVSKDAAVDTTPGTGIDPVSDGAALQVFNAAGGSDAVCFGLPAARWRAKGKGGSPTFKYRDERFASGPCKSATVKDGKRLTVSCQAKVKPIGYSLDEQAQGSVAVRFRSGSTEYCAAFGGTVTKDAQGKAFKAKGAPAPSVCPVPDAACP